MQEWHVLYTKPHSEFRVQAALRIRGIESYLPALPVAHPRAGRASLAAFFPCYLFAHFDLASIGESNIIYLPGLRNLVMVGGKPATVPSEMVAHMVRRLEASTALIAGGQVLTRGDRVRVLTPGLEAFDAVFEARLSQQGRVRILVSYLERRYPPYRSIEHFKPVEIGIEQIQKIPHA
jgi:transcription antitermination factor NusG